MGHQRGNIAPAIGSTSVPRSHNGNYQIGAALTEKTERQKFAAAAHRKKAACATADQKARFGTLPPSRFDAQIRPLPLASGRGAYRMYEFR
jgi:hypothetical protein